MTTINARIASLLETIDRPGSFCASGSAAFLAPALHVTGVGPIALPLLPAQAEQLLSVAEPAPYGKGGLTLLDPAVRRCWQLEPGQVDIAGRRWAETLQEIVARAAAGLGVSDPVSASFYKLLIYGPGSFFVPHRDTEKEPGMFATLVIVLPSAYAGGELIVRHKDREARLALRSEDPAEIAFAAFYADCLHEILPLDDGYRLTLVYNLIRQGRGTLPQPPDYRPQTDGIAAALDEWRTEQKTWLPAAGPARDRADVAKDEESEEDSDEEEWDEDESDEDARDEDDWDEGEDEQADSIGRPGPSAEKLVFPLEYAYTQAERSFAALKGTDAAIATALTAAARQAGYSLSLSPC